MPSFVQNLKTAWENARDNNTGLLSAGIAFYAFLSTVPLLGVAMLSYGLFVEPEQVAEHASRITRTLPPSAADLVKDQLTRLSEQDRNSATLGLALALGFSLFGARVGAGAVITGFNVAFEAQESRGFIKSNLLAIAITLGAVLGMGLVAGASALATSLLAETVARIAGSVAILVAGAAGATLAYRIVPNVDSIDFKDALPGGALFAIGWVLTSSAFSFYTANFASYDATYGSIGAVVVLLTWLFLSAWFLLVGAHVAAALAARRAEGPENERPLS